MRILVAIALVFSLAACTNDANDPVEPQEVEEVAGAVTVERGLPEGIEAGDRAAVGVGIDSGGNLVVIHFGSSSNPYRVTEAALEGDQIGVTLENERDKPATMDLVATTSTVVFEGGLPSGMVTVVIEDFGTVSLDTTPGTVVWLDSK